jgi:predicted O-linked N-acetylglucosamine transferase (SPINDLY family)
MAKLSLQQASELALRHHRSGQLAQAERLYRQILAVEPNHPQTLHWFGFLAHQMGRHDIAIGLIERSLAARPDDVEARFHLSAALLACGEFDRAIAEARRVITTKPEMFGAYSLLGDALVSKRHIEQAIAVYRQGLAIHPAWPEGLNNLGGLLAACEKVDDSIAALRQAVALKPTLVQAHSNLGCALKAKGRLDESIAAFRQAIAHDGQDAQSYSYLGNVLREAGRLDEAIVALRQAVTLGPTLATIGSNLVYALHFHPAYDAAAIAQEQRRWNQRHAEPLRKFLAPHANDRNPDRRLRIGYVSADFRDHVVGRNLLPLFRRHDREQFEITCYSQLSRADEIAAEFQRIAHRWRNISGVPDEQAAAQIRDDEIDILVDLTLHMGGSRLTLFARKPAPVQFTFAGYPGSTGLATIDYRLSDPYLDPPGMDESVYSEQTLRLPHSFWCYDPLECRDVPVNPLPALTQDFVTFGCLNNFSKINDVTLDLWLDVLTRVPRSRLVLMAHSGGHRQATLDRLSRCGVEADRVRFVSFQPRPEYLAEYHHIDIGLDSFPYNGHTTSLDSFWMGVPVVTLCGETAVSRAGLCQLSNLHLGELAATDREQFVRIAVQLAGDLPHLQHLRSSLRGRMETSPLMDAAQFARGVEAAYRQAWKKWV